MASSGRKSKPKAPPRFRKSRSAGKTPSDKVSSLQKKFKKLKCKDKIVGIPVDMEKLGRTLATDAISYLHRQGHNVELVKPGLYHFGTVPRGTMFHINFEAKRIDEPGAPVETFFGQVRHGDGMTVNCCVSLGASDSLPTHPVNNGLCAYCGEKVYHPIGGCPGIEYGWPEFESDDFASEDESD